MRRGSFPFRVSGCAAGALAAFVAFPAGAQTPAAAPAEEAAQPGASVVTLPLTDGGLLLGEIDAFSSPEGEIRLPSARLIDLIGPRLEANARERLSARLSATATIDLAAAEALDTPIRYDPERLELAIDIPAELRARRDVSLIDADLLRLGPAETPARFSAYLTARGAIDYVHQSDNSNSGFGNSSIILTGAVRFAGLVAESLALWRPGEDGPDFQRQASRLVYDDPGSVLRVTAGDLIVVPRLFQNAPDAAGISFVRSYHLLQPMRIVRPTGARSFELTTPSTVDILVNGQSARRLRLGPGNYDVRDFPFAQGANEIRVLVDQGAGPQEALRYSIFYDPSQLQKGLDEFAFYAGVHSFLGPNGPEYSDDWLASGFYRRGLSDSITAGVNMQADARTAMAGLEALWSSPIGLFSGDLAVSRADSFGTGWALSLGFERLFAGSGSFDVRFESRSKEFAPLGGLPPNNPFSWELGVGISRTFTERFYAGADVTYSKGRGTEQDRGFYRGNLGYQLTPRLNLEVTGTYEDSPDHEGFSVYASLTVRFGERTTGHAEFDSRFDRGRVAFSAFGGQDVGAWDVNLDAAHGSGGGDFNGVVNYTAERALLGLSHLTTWDEGLDHITDQRTSARAAFSLAFADGRFALARPILNGFAIVEPHASARGARVIVNPVENSHLTQSGGLGPAVVPDLSAYAEREIFVEPEGMPEGYDIGPGAYRFVAPYRAGYRIIVGSDYWLTGEGRILRADGNALRYVAGEAVEEVHPEREPITFFSSNDGSFSIAGLRAGRWTMTMHTDPPTRYVIDVQESEDGIVRLGVLSPVAEP